MKKRILWVLTKKKIYHEEKSNRKPTKKIGLLRLMKSRNFRNLLPIRDVICIRKRLGNFLQFW